MGERWGDMTPRERAFLIRDHAGGMRPLSEDTVRRLFQISEDGLRAIRNGADWSPEHSDDTP